MAEKPRKIKATMVSDLNYNFEPFVSLQRVKDFLKMVKVMIREAWKLYPVAE
jgi:hypothetical protein